MSARLNASELDAWQRLQSVTEMLRREVGRGLRSDADLSDAEFTVLAHLVEAGGEARPSEVSRSIGWESSRVAHQLGRLERRGLLERAAGGGNDGRAQRITLTTAGRDAHRRAVGPHLRAAKRWFADALDAEQVEELRGILSALETHAARIAATAEERDA